MASAMGSMKGGGDGSGGNSSFDLAAIEQALGQNMSMMHNRYTQLGLGVPMFNGQFGPMTGPGGIGAQAASSGQSLQYGGAGTAEQTDMSGLQQMAQAALGQLQNQNMNNAAIAGTPANQLQNIQNANQQQQGAAFNAGASQPSGIPNAPTTAG